MRAHTTQREGGREKERETHASARTHTHTHTHRSPSYFSNLGADLGFFNQYLQVIRESIAQV